MGVDFDELELRLMREFLESASASLPALRSTTTTTAPTTTTTSLPCEPTDVNGPAQSPTTFPVEKTPAATTSPTTTTAPTSEPAPMSSAPQQKAPAGQWTPTEDPKATIVPGQMRSDREEIPAPFTKADADKAETMGARISTARLTAGCTAVWPSDHTEMNR